MADFKIHPAFGIARVGDSPGPGFFCSNQARIPSNWNYQTESFNKFKDDQGRIKRQGVRFQVFKYDDTGKVVGEVVPGQDSVTAIEWTVHVANRKASFFRFEGPLGEDGDYSKNCRRNNSVPDSQRATLIIDPGLQTISGRSVPPIVLRNPNRKMNADIPDLGDISTDKDGRLIFFGGHGKTCQQGPDINNYVNNDGWFDDVSDGPVTATIIFTNGARVSATSAWVCVGPPDFAPPIGHIVSLYDLMWDLAVRTQIPLPGPTGGAMVSIQFQRGDWNPATNRFRTFKPSYVNDVADLLQRALNAMFVHAPPDSPAFHNTIGPQVWAELGDPSPANAFMREAIFDRIRDPDATALADSTQMPRGLGDEYCDEKDFAVGSPERANPKRFFSLTRVQYAMLDQWRRGNFIADGPGPRKLKFIPGAGTAPDGIDLAALEGCVGGPFFPGIEVSWTARNPNIYFAPFRIRPGVSIANGVVTGPGFFTQSMALPWQADFRECKREALTNPKTGEPTHAMWWAGQRPDDVYPEDDPNNQVPWARPPHFTASDDDNARFDDMVKNWSTLGFVARRSADGFKWLETERKR